MLSKYSYLIEKSQSEDVSEAIDRVDKKNSLFERFAKLDFCPNNKIWIA